MTTVTLPKLGEMTEDAVLIEWLVEVGSRVTEGEPLVTVDTDKVEADVPSPVTGIVRELLAEVEQELPVGAGLCTIEEET